MPLFDSDVVLEDWPWPRGCSRTKIMSLALASALRALALALDLRAVASALRVLVLGLGLEGPGLDYKHVNFILWDASCQCVSPIFSKFRLSM